MVFGSKLEARIAAQHKGRDRYHVVKSVRKEDGSPQEQL